MLDRILPKYLYEHNFFDADLILCGEPFFLCPMIHHVYLTGVKGLGAADESDDDFRVIGLLNTALLNLWPWGSNRATLQRWYAGLTLPIQN